MRVAWLALMVVAVQAKAQPPAAARASIDTKGEIWVGQKVTLAVVLRAPGYFANAPAFDLPRVSGVILMGPEGRPVIGSETVDDTSFTTQRHEIAVYAQRAGRVAVPGFTVRFETSPAYGQPSVEQRVKTSAVSFMAKMPPGAEGFATVITTSELTLKENWTPEPGNAPVHPGAAFSRTITAEAQGVPGMVLPSFHIDPPEGLGAYPKPPVVEDRTDRGDSTGRRVEMVTYLCEASGTLSLPALALAWWDPDERTLKRVSLPGRTFEVLAPPPTTENRPEPASLWPWIIGTLATVLAAALFARRFGSRARAGWKRHLAAAAGSEPVCFAAFERACRAGDARAAHRAFFVWLDRLFPNDPAPTASGLTVRAGDPDLAAEIAALEAATYGRGNLGGNTWKGSELAWRARRTRSRLRRDRVVKPVNRGLPPLNPTH